MHGHLGVLKWLAKNRTEGCSTNAMDWAAKEGKLVRTDVRTSTILSALVSFSGRLSCSFTNQCRNRGTL